VANTTRIAAVKDALCDGLQADAALEGVQVSSAELAWDRAANEGIWLIGEDTIEQEWGPIGRHARDEALTLVGMAYARKPGKGEDVIRAARSRAVELVGAIEDYLTRPGGDRTIGGTVKAARCRPAELSELADDRGRIAMIRFEILTQLTRLVGS
jgi:hypothetical protein